MREVPELAELMATQLRARRRARLPLYGAAAAAVTGHRRLALLSFGAWCGARAVSVAQSEPSWARRMRILPLDLAVEAVTAAALVVGSARARHLVL
jgi:transposase